MTPEEIRKYPNVVTAKHDLLAELVAQLAEVNETLRRIADTNDERGNHGK